MNDAKILVIEDTRDIREEIETILKLEGFFTISAGSGEEGLDLARREKPDLVVCDVMMPGMDGFMVLKAFQDDPGFESIPFIFLTARTSRSDMRFGMNIGADDYLTKPFQAQDLLTAVRSRIQRHERVRKPILSKITRLREEIVWALPEELLQPLDGIIGMSGLIASGEASLSQGQASEMGRMIRSTAETLKRKVDRFMFYTDLQLKSTHPEEIQKLRNESIYDPEVIVERSAINVARIHGRVADLDLRVSGGAIAMGGFYLERLVQEMLDSVFESTPPGTPVRLVGKGSEMNSFYTINVRFRASVPDRVTLFTQNGRAKNHSLEAHNLDVAGLLSGIHGGNSVSEMKSGGEREWSVRIPAVESERGFQ